MSRQSVLEWARGIAPRRAGVLALALASLLTIANYALQATLNYPAILLDRPALAQALVAQGGIAAPLGMFGMLLCGVLVTVIALGTEAPLETAARGLATRAGVAAGLCWTAGGLLGLALLPLWAAANSRVGPALAAIVLALAAIAAPVLLAIWTVGLARQLQAHRALGWVGAIGLVVAALRSALWGLNALLPVTSGYYGTAGVLNLLATLGESLWLVWLFLLGFHLLRWREGPAGSAATGAGQRASEEEGEHAALGRRNLLKLGAKLGATLGVGLVGGVFVLARTGLTVAAAPAVDSDDIPTEPSLVGTLMYSIALIYVKLVNPVHSVAQWLRTPVPATPPPSDVAIHQVDADGVPAQVIVAPGSVTSRWIMYIHGGGFAQAGTNDNRAFVGRLSKATGASALYPDYRLIPEHPFPAGLNDCVTAYRWLRKQGIAASRIVIAGESAGGTLILATAVALRESGEEPPAALIAISPPTDMAMTGESFRTRALVEASPGVMFAQDVFAIYTNHGATNPRNPLVSPLYADVRGFPPTLLQVGTQEMFLSDATRMADRLKAAGVETKLEIWPGMFHAFTAGPDIMPEARMATQHVAKFMRRHLGA
jgi:acetyl esterase/lipase